MYEDDIPWVADMYCSMKRDESAGLHGVVHPLFSRINFPGAEYDKLLPGLRLATLLIDTDCLLGYWHTLWFGCSAELYDEHKGERYSAYFRRRHGLSAKDVAMTRAGLRTLSHMVRFYRLDCKEVSGMCCYGESSLQSPSASAPFATGDFTGTISTIYYDEAVYQQLCQLDEDDTAETYRRLHFDWAALVLHEVAHAASSAAYSSAFELPFESNIMAEAGFAWEANIFGGLVKSSDDSQMLAEWPSAATVKWYMHKGWAMRIHGRCPDVETQWDIPYSFIRRLFTEPFWRNVVPQDGADAFRVPKLRGYRYDVCDEGTMALIDFRQAEFETGLPDECCIDHRYSSSIRLLAPGSVWDGFGRLMRINVAELFPDVCQSRYWRCEQQILLRCGESCRVSVEDIDADTVRADSWYDS